MVSHTVGDILLEDIDGHEENAVICSHEASLRLSFGSPFVARVAPRTFILLCAPRVPQSDKLGLCTLSVSDLNNALHSVGVAVGETHRILRKVVAAGGTACHDVSAVVALLEESPEAGEVVCIICVLNLRVGRAIDSANRQRRVSTCDVIVAAVELCESFFEDRTPNRPICSDLGVDGAAIVLIQRQVVVDDNCVRDSKGVEVHSVDTDRADLIHVVEEDLLHATGVLSDGRGGGHEPAVADRALANVCRPDARRTEEGLALEGVLSPLPFGLLQVLRLYVDLLGIFPEESSVVVGELTVCVDDTAVCFRVVVVIEVWKLLLVAVEGALANCRIDISVLGSSHCLGKDHVEG